MAERLKALGLDAPAWESTPVAFWDVFGASGHPVRATISDMGPLLLGRLLELNETQRGVLTLVFKIADDAGLLLLDVEGPARDARVRRRERGDVHDVDYGNMSAASIGAIQRGARCTIESRAADQFFGEPMLNIEDLIQTDAGGRGVVNILAADRLMQSPKLYATFLLWMLSELFERLPEVGDLPKPKIVFFFDEAHLLFDDAPEALRREDRAGRAPDSIEGRRRVLRHAESARRSRHRARPARQSRAARAARVHAARPEGRAHGGADDAAESGDQHRTGDHRAERRARRWCRSSTRRARRPIVERAWILPPASRIGPLTPAERAAVVSASVVRGHYEAAVDRESAYEKLKARAEAGGESGAPMPVRVAAGVWTNDRSAAHTHERRAAGSAVWVDGARAAASARACSSRRPRARRGRLGPASGGRFCAGCSGRCLGGGDRVEVGSAGNRSALPPRPAPHSSGARGEVGPHGSPHSPLRPRLGHSGSALPPRSAPHSSGARGEVGPHGSPTRRFNGSRRDPGHVQEHHAALPPRCPRWNPGTGAVSNPPTGDPHAQLRLRGALVSSLVVLLSLGSLGVASPAYAQQRLRVGGEVKEPKKIKDVKPVYPADAQAAGVQGIVIIEALIGTDGLVKEAKVLRGVQMLDAAALEAVMQWRYTPTLLNGDPVELIMTVTVTFTLSSSAPAPAGGTALVARFERAQRRGERGAHA